MPGRRPPRAMGARSAPTALPARTGSDWAIVAAAYNSRTMDAVNATPTTTVARIRPDIITDAFLATLRAHGVVRASLFGSVARGEERPDSDIDLLGTFAPGVGYGEQFLLAEELAKLSGRRVDVATNLHPAFAPSITPTLMSLPL